MSKEVILGEQEELVRGPFKTGTSSILRTLLPEERIGGRKKATKRYEKLKAEDRFRTKVELWTDDDDIQIIR